MIDLSLFYFESREETWYQTKETKYSKVKGILYFPIRVIVKRKII